MPFIARTHYPRRRSLSLTGLAVTFLTAACGAGTPGLVPRQKISDTPSGQPKDGTAPTDSSNQKLTEKPKPAPTKLPQPTPTLGAGEVGQSTPESLDYLDGHFALDQISMVRDVADGTEKIDLQPAITGELTTTWKNTGNGTFQRSLSGYATVSFKLDGEMRDFSLGCQEGDMAFETSLETSTGRIVADGESTAVANAQPCVATWQKGSIIPPVYEANSLIIPASSVVKTETGFKVRETVKMRIYGDRWVDLDFSATYRRITPQSP